jgi:hypothetical protein
MGKISLLSAMDQMIVYVFTLQISFIAIDEIELGMKMEYE